MGQRVAGGGSWGRRLSASHRLIHCSLILETLAGLLLAPFFGWFRVGCWLSCTGSCKVGGVDGVLSPCLHSVGVALPLVISVAETCPCVGGTVGSDVMCDEQQLCLCQACDVDMACMAAAASKTPPQLHLSQQQCSSRHAPRVPANTRPSASATSCKQHITALQSVKHGDSLQQTPPTYTYIHAPVDTHHPTS